MSPADFKTVMKIAETADSGCSYCVQGMFNILAAEFPDYRDLLEERAKELNLHLPLTPELLEDN